MPVKPFPYPPAKAQSPPHRCNSRAPSAASPSGGVFKQPHFLKDAQNVGEERFTISEPAVEKVTDAMYGVVNEGGTGNSLKLAGIELSGKSGTAQVIGYATRERLGKQKKFEDNAWFVGYAPRRNPEIVVSVLVQESGQHGGTASGPVVRDIIKAYYDKKNKNTSTQTTVNYQHYDLGDGKNPGDTTALANDAQNSAISNVQASTDSNAKKSFPTLPPRRPQQTPRRKNPTAPKFRTRTQTPPAQQPNLRILPEAAAVNSKAYTHT